MLCSSSLVRTGTTFMLLLVVCVFTTSCVTETPNYMKRHKVHGDSSHRKFAKIKNYKVRLHLASTRRSFHPGYDAVLTYKLTNTGGKPVRIDEWLMNDPDNLKIYYRPYQKGLKKFIASEWTCVVPTLKKPVRRFELDLQPKNSAMVHKTLSFVKDMPVDKNPPHKKYFIIASLNLKSIKAFSKASVIELKPKSIYTQGKKL